MQHRDNAFSLPIRILYRPPNTLLYFMILIHAGAMFCMFPIALSLELKAVILILMTLNFLRFYAAFSHDTQVKHQPLLLLNRDNEWTLIDKDNNAVALKLEPGAFVHSLLVVLRFSVAEKKIRSFILNSENVEHNLLRRLRVRLLHDNRAA
jgi:hypothetical protein